MLRIATDSTVDMPAGWQKEYDIDIIPINIQFGEKTYLQGIDLDTEGFYRMVDETRTIPKTSQPTPHQFNEFYQKIAKKGDTVLSMHVTGKLSGTYDSAVIAARELETKMKIIPFDSLNGSAGLGMMCREARLMDRAGAGVEKILKRMETIRDTLSIVLALDTLEYARMSGRVKTLQAALASLLNPLEDAVVISTDLSHHFPYDEARRLDNETIDYIIEGNSKAIFSRSGDGGKLCCGFTGVLVAIALGKKWGLGKPKLLMYHTSGDTFGDRYEVVGYASIAWPSPESAPIETTA